MNAQQTKYIPRDTIVTIFKKNNIYDAIDKINNLISYERGDLDYKSLYFDKEIKTYFLKSLNRNSRCQYELENKNREYIKLLDDKKRLEYEVESYLYRKKRSKQIDSILKSEKLILKLKDSVIADRILLYKNGRDCKGAIPNLDLITKIKYREAYDSIKKWSKELLEWNFTEELLAFNDPDAVIIFNDKVANYVKNNGENEFYASYSQRIRGLNTAYSYSKLIDLITIKKDELVMQAPVYLVDGRMVSDDVYRSANYQLLGGSNLFFLLKYYKLPFDNLNDEYKINHGRDSKKQNEFIQRNRFEIKKAILELVKIKQKEEEYWMKNMPFYKKK
ncbi:hypothetical protein BWK59_05590 [Flavobacterium davisii]|uniref:Uncharacterized protein n=2 Tax=Flavobacterium davisii TaxID=2906077 RepID=A0A246GJD9_9FLAO|nr:hypothetical protein BWK59_05590 [Flavobacterium davisii]